MEQTESSQVISHIHKQLIFYNVIHTHTVGKGFWDNWIS
jgi:hypothetical protein